MTGRTLATALVWLLCLATLVSGLWVYLRWMDRLMGGVA